MTAAASNLPEREEGSSAPGWHLIEEPRVHVYSDETIESVSHGITRDSDGFTLTWEGGNLVEEFEIFRGRAGSDIFEFIADRKRTPNGSTTYTIAMSISDAPPEMILKHAKDIEAALRVLPFNNLEAEEVKFDVSKPLTKQCLVNAEDIELWLKQV